MKKKGILSFSIFLILVIAIAVYCWPVSRVWFPEPEKLQLIDVNVYENGIVKQLSEEEMQAICQLLSSMKTTRNLGAKAATAWTIIRFPFLSAMTLFLPTRTPA